MLLVGMSAQYEEFGIEGASDTLLQIIIETVISKIGLSVS